MNHEVLTAAQHAEILAEALPYIQNYHAKTMVIKIGGQAVADPVLKAGFARDVALLQLVGIHPVVVHGGGPNIPAFLERLNVKSDACGTQPLNDARTRDFVEMVLGELNQELVGLINRHGGKAVGLSGLDGPHIYARTEAHPELAGADGVPAIVGAVERIDPEVILLLQTRNFVPVIMPIGVGPDGEAVFIDADSVAGRLAQALEAEKLVVMADTPGVVDSSGHFHEDLSAGEIQALLDAPGRLAADSVARLLPVLDAVKSGVACAHITDARVPSALLLEVLTSEGIGSLLRSRRGPDFGPDTLRYFGNLT